MSFSEGMDQCIRTSLPVLFLALTFLSLSLTKATHSTLGKELLGHEHNETETPKTFTRNELLLGSSDPFFWFLVPLFGLICVGVCITANYAVLALTHVFTVIYSSIRSVTLRNDEGRCVPCPTLRSPRAQADRAQTNINRFRNHIACPTSGHNKCFASDGRNHHSLPVRLHGALPGAVGDVYSSPTTSSRNSEFPHLPVHQPCTDFPGISAPEPTTTSTTTRTPSSSSCSGFSPSTSPSSSFGSTTSPCTG